MIEIGITSCVLENNSTNHIVEVLNPGNGSIEFDCKSLKKAKRLAKAIKKAVKKNSKVKVSKVSNEIHMVRK